MSAAPGEFKELLQELVGAGVEFVLIGGLAVNYHGVIRSTEDIVIVPAPARDNLERLAGVLRRLEAHVPGSDPRFDPLSAEALSGGITVKCLTRHGALHIVQGQAGMPRYDELAAEAAQGELDDVTVRVCSYEHLVAMKRTSGRPQDEIDLADLARARGDAP